MTLEEKIIIAFSKGRKTRRVLDSLKRKFAKKESKGIVKNSQLLEAYHELVKEKRIKVNSEIKRALRIRKIRSLSGIVIVSVLTKPYPCPGKCIYCPQQEGAPKSYLQEEPAVSRAIMCHYQPYRQVQTRIRALEATGHPTDKIDLRIIGATWSFYPKKYQTWFIKECLRAANDFPENKKVRTTTLEKIQKENETAKHRLIGITIETRPDFIDEEEIKRLRRLGITRVELGVQSIYDDVLEKNKRGHNIGATIKATRLLKDAGFKVCYQAMPNLLGSDLKRDLEMFKQIFQNPDFKPDYLKIYPCALLKKTPLYKFWQKGEYKPYSEKRLIDLLIKIKKITPRWVRIQRIIRDIPTNYIVEGGTKTSNMRQVIEKISKEQDWHCKCIRCREVKENYNPEEKLKLFREDYDASEGKEIFLSFENKNRTKLYSLLRMRLPSQTLLPVLKNSAIIRELHTYGQLVAISKKEKAAQHKGLGKKLMQEAEKIAKSQNKKYIAVISGIGVRGYYKKLGYGLKQTYMIKRINN